jgi:phage tail protein X
VASISEVFTALDRDMVRSACSKFRGRIEAVIEANGDFIE